MALRLIPKRLVGQTVRGIRNRMGQTQEQFAESIGASSGDVVAGWEEGRTQPDAGTLAKIAAMGLVDVLVFHDDVPADELPQLTPGEASELRAILSRMEALLGEAREIVEAAADRTAVEVLEAASSARLPTPAGLEADSVTLAAEVTVRPRARKTAGSTGGSSSSGGSKARSSSSRSGGSKSSGGGSKSTGGHSGSSSSRSSSGSSSSRSSGSSSTGSSSSKSGSSGSRSRSGGGSGRGRSGGGNSGSTSSTT